MLAHRAKILGATIMAAGTALLLAGTPAGAQIDQETAVNILRECAKIDDATARLACYDNNIRNVGGTPRAAVPGRMTTPQGGGAPIDANSPRGFGAEDVRTPDRFAAPTGQLQQISARVSAIRPREPGIYAFTLEDGAEWLFAEGVTSSYRAPRVGSVVEIERGSLGSYLMRFDEQTPVPVRRVR
jgi:hypothetical protein